MYKEPQTEHVSEEQRRVTGGEADDTGGDTRKKPRRDFPGGQAIRF